jgi:MOSC domain-containing protein YiiM
VPELSAIWIKRMKRGPIDPALVARFVAARGIIGNANQGGRRQVTLLAHAHWNEITAHLPSPDPIVRRANLLLAGIDLRASLGKTLRIGSVRIRILGETRPCERMDEACPGLRQALAVPWGGGAFGEVLTDGDVSVGDSAAWD